MITTNFRNLIMSESLYVIFGKLFNMVTRIHVNELLRVRGRGQQLVINILSKRFKNKIAVL